MELQAVSLARPILVGGGFVLELVIGYQYVYGHYALFLTTISDACSVLSLAKCFSDTFAHLASNSFSFKIFCELNRKSLTSLQSCKWQKQGKFHSKAINGYSELSVK